MQDIVLKNFNYSSIILPSSSEKRMVTGVMEIQGNIKKMRTVLDEPAQYYLPKGNQELKIDDLIGSYIHLEYLGEINCIRCGRTIK